MNVLMISDETESKSFGQILSLKKEIQGSGKNNVNMFIFSNTGIFLNQERIGKKPHKAVNLLERILSKKYYL